MEPIDRDDLARRTRDVYQKQHERLADERVFERYLGMSLDPGYYHLRREDFAGIEVLDAGCGNSGYLEVAFHEFGVGRITCLDIGEAWQASLGRELARRGVPPGKVNFVAGSTDALPFADASFDRVVSNGVLVHLADREQAGQAFAELARVTRPGAHLYVQLGCAGGLLERIYPAVREYYAESEEFRELVDGLTPATFRELLGEIARGMLAHTGEAFDTAALEALLDEDYCVTLQNLIQAPVRITVALDEAWLRGRYALHGFAEPLRCKRYVRRKNIRKYTAPLHFDHDSRVSRILYGGGNLEFIAAKRDR